MAAIKSTRNTLSLSDKLKIIDEVENGVKYIRRDYEDI